MQCKKTRKSLIAGMLLSSIYVKFLPIIEKTSEW